MINVNNFRPGLTFQYENNIYIIIETQHSKSGRGQAHVKTKVKNLRNNATTNITFIGGEKVKKIIINKIEMQYLYSDVNTIFMDIKTYEQLEIPTHKLVWEKNFLKEGIIISVTKYNGEILGIVLPDKVYLTIMQVEAVIKGGANSGAMKRAMLETGFELYVPLFIKKGEIIIISTSDGKYYGRS